MTFSEFIKFNREFFAWLYSDELKIIKDVSKYCTWLWSENPYLFYYPLIIFLAYTIFWSMFSGSLVSIMGVNQRHEFLVKNSIRKNNTVLTKVFFSKNKLKTLYSLYCKLYV